MLHTAEISLAAYEESAAASVSGGARPDEFAVGNELRATLPDQERTAGTVGNEADMNRIGSVILPEIPSSHSDIDPATITIKGIMQCPYYAERYKRDPEGTQAEVVVLVQQMHEGAALASQGMSAKEVRQRALAESLARAKEKAKAFIESETSKQATAAQQAQKPAEATQVAVEMPPALTQPELPELKELAGPVPAVSAAAEIAHAQNLLHTMSRQETAVIPVPRLSHADPTENKHEAGQMPVAVEVVAATAVTVVEDISIEPIEVGRLTINEQAAVEVRPSVEVGEHIIDIDAENLDQQPSEPYTEFTDALRALITVPLDQDGSELPISGMLENQPVPDIAIAVAEQLSQLEADEKELAVSTITNIVDTVNLIHTLEGKQAASGAMEVPQAELRAQVTILFEQLGIEYKAEDVEQFIAVLLKLELQLAGSQRAELSEIDLEHDGTHEAKLHFTQLLGNLTEVEGKVQRILGRLMLLDVISSHMTSTNLEY